MEYFYDAVVILQWKCLLFCKADVLCFNIPKIMMQENIEAGVNMPDVVIQQ